MPTYLHESPCGLCEYRLASDTVTFALESRMLRPDGHPYDDRWYRVNDAALSQLQDVSDIVALLREDFLAATRGV